jgi:hypothetical protein
MSPLIEAIKNIDRNVLALVLSILPGLGHLAKRYYIWGLTILIAGNALAVFVAAWLALATFGLSLIVVPTIWVAAVAWSAFMLPDRHRPATATPPPTMNESGHLR